MKDLHWLNEPDSWEQKEDSLSLFVTPKTDFWRKTHYGFIVDDGPFLYAQRSGEFEVKVKITGAYQSRFDQMGLMIRASESVWIKSGIEYVDGKINVSAVVTHDHSDWSIIELEEHPESLWFKAKRVLDAIEVFYSYDDQNYNMIRLAHFPANTMAMVGMYAASPDGDGFQARFDDFQINHLPDEGRLKWLNENKS